MGFNFSGIAISKNYQSHLDELSKEFGWELEFLEEISFEKASSNWKEEGICDIYFSKKGTLVFVNHSVDPMSIQNDKVLTFTINEISMSFFLSLCQSHKLERLLMVSNGITLSEEGEPLLIERFTKDIEQIIFNQLDEILGESFGRIDLDRKAYRYKLIGANTKTKRLENEPEKQILTDDDIHNLLNKFKACIDSKQEKYKATYQFKEHDKTEIFSLETFLTNEGYSPKEVQEICSLVVNSKKSNWLTPSKKKSTPFMIYTLIFLWNLLGASIAFCLLAIVVRFLFDIEMFTWKSALIGIGVLWALLISRSSNKSRSLITILNPK